jgi:tetratricopeptide (TPR) repeat protein
LRTHGQLPQSLTDCSKAIELNPADSAAYVCRAQFYLATGAPQPAVEDINRAMLIGQSPAEAATLLSAAQRMIDTKAAPPAPAPQQAQPAQPAVVAEARPAPTPPPMPATQPAPIAAPPAAVPVVASAAPPVVKPPAAPPQVAQKSSAPVPANVKPPQVVAASVPKTARDANRIYRQGRYLAEQENFEQAVQAFDQVLQIDPNHSLALNARGYARLRLRNFQGAISDCSQAIRLNPSYANAYLNRSVARRATGDVAGARDDQHRATELDSIAQATPGKP